MSLNKLAVSVRQKQQELKLSLSALAKAIGVNVQGVAGVVKGKTTPNASTALKYAKFLGLSAEEFSALSKSPTKPTIKGKKARRKAKPGRKAKGYKKAEKDIHDQPAKTVPTKKPKDVTLAKAVEITADTLAVAVHDASAEQRRIILAILGG
jgi:transcriptional regulator with XRE-family HTH domain